MTKRELKYYHNLKQKKFRDSENKFLIEGIHLIEECLRSLYFKDKLEKVFVRTGFGDTVFLRKLRDNKNNIEIIELKETEFNLLTDTVSSQGISGVVSKPETPEVKDHFKENCIAVALDTINDPGNLGTILRTCHCFGIDEIIVGRNSADIYNPKTIRSTQGALFNLRIRDEIALENELENYFRNGFEIILTCLDTVMYVNEYKFIKGGKYIIVFGNEAGGISENILRNNNYKKIKIKLFSDCESLNVSVAAGIVLSHIKNIPDK